MNKGLKPKIIALVDKNMTARAIAEKLGCHQNYVEKIQRQRPKIKVYLSEEVFEWLWAEAETIGCEPSDIARGILVDAMMEPAR